MYIYIYYIYVEISLENSYESRAFQVHEIVELYSPFANDSFLYCPLSPLQKKKNPLVWKHSPPRSRLITISRVMAAVGAGRRFSGCLSSTFPSSPALRPSPLEGARVSKI